MVIIYAEGNYKVKVASRHLVFNPKKEPQAHNDTSIREQLICRYRFRRIVFVNNFRSFLNDSLLTTLLQAIAKKNSDKVYR